MTRSLTVTNTSNWDGEDYRVPVPHGEPAYLKPGDSICFTPPDGWTPGPIQEAQSKKPVPFLVPAVNSGGKRRDLQVMPDVRVVFTDGDTPDLDTRLETLRRMVFNLNGQVSAIREDAKRPLDR